MNRKREPFMKLMSIDLRRVLLLAGLALAVGLAGCTATEDDNSTNTFVQIVAMGDGDGSAIVFSDVCLGSDQDPPVCSVINDNFEVEMQAFVKDQSRPPGVVFNDITFTRYRVTYIRSDGRNVPGVDVPFPFDGAANFSLPLGTSVTVGFIGVRHQAKLESPIRELAGTNRPGLGPGILSVLAQVDFFGTDTAGRPISVSGTISVSFADFPG